MIEVLFFNSTGDINVIADNVFHALGMPFNLQGTSSHSLTGEYSSLSVFGLSIKLEPNTYDYEDDYRYMISVYKDKLTDLVVNEGIILPVSKIIARLLADNLGVIVAHEDSNNLEIYRPANG